MSGPASAEILRLAAEVRDASTAHQVASDALRKADAALVAARAAQRSACARHDAAQAALVYFAEHGKHDPRVAMFAEMRMSEPRGEAAE